MKKVFISGATGFIGQALANKLIKEGYQVTGLTRSTKKARSKGMKWVLGDIRDQSWHKDVLECDSFIHLAGVHGSVKMSFQDRLSIELDGIKNAVEAAKRAKTSHFIYISTAYFDAGTDYAKAKNISKKWLETQIKQGFPATIICPVTVYGPGDTVNTNRIFKLASTGVFFFIRKKQNFYYIFIDDLIDALVLVIKYPSKYLGKTLVIGDPNIITLEEFVEKIALVKGKSLWKIYLPRYPMMIVGKIGDLLAKLGIVIPFGSNSAKTMSASYNFDVETFPKISGFKPKITLEEGIEKTVRWYDKRKII